MRQLICIQELLLPAGILIIVLLFIRTSEVETILFGIIATVQEDQQAQTV